MAPESLKKREYSKKSDVYMFGITMWEILNGKEPYGKKPLIKIAIEVLHKNRRPSIKRTTNLTLVQMMTKAWKGKAEDRPDMSELKRILSTLQDDDGMFYIE